MTTVYQANLAKGAIWVRKQFAQEAVERAAKASLTGNLNDALMYSREANRHESVIMGMMKVAAKGVR